MGVAGAPKAATAPKAAAPKGKTPAKGMAGMAGMKRHDSDDMDGAEHIAKMGTCSAMGPIKKGDTVHIDANYNFALHKGMKTKTGAMTEVMGIAILYLAVQP